MRHAVFASLLVLVSSLLIVPLGWATWGVTFRNLGTATVVGEPECADFGAQKVVCVAQGADHALMANEFNKTTWSGWTSISTVVSSNARCVNDANNRIVCWSGQGYHNKQDCVNELYWIKENAAAIPVYDYTGER